MALAMSPEKRMPPSAISGTPLPARAVATLSMAVICGTPTPALVVWLLSGFDEPSTEIPKTAEVPAKH
jgi:hypothetical protein